MYFDRIEHTTCLLHKSKLYCVYDMSHLLVVEDYEFSKSISDLLCVSFIMECVRILNWPMYILYFNCLPDDILCKIAIWADDTALNLSCDKPSHLLQQSETAYALEFYLKIKIVGKCYYVLLSTIWFWSVKIWHLMLSIQAQNIKIVIRNMFNKNCFKDLKFLTPLFLKFY